MTRLGLLSGAAVLASVLLSGAPACAQNERMFDIPPSELADALNRWAAQSDQQILFSGRLVAGMRSPGLRGRYTPSEALNRLLANTGLTWSETRPGVAFLRRDTEQLTSIDPVELGEIIVTGSLLKSSGPPSSPVVALSRDDLDARGFATVAESLTSLPQNYAGSGTPAALLGLADGAGGNAALATGINLRGFGPGATLTLVNGRRLAGTGSRGAFADASALPSAAVERVDVLLDGASAQYGSDAVAGVVNIIMRSAFDGQESRLRLGAADGGAEDVMVSHMAGRTWSSGAALIALEHQTSQSLNTLDRPYTATADLRPFGGSDRRALFATPGNIVAYDPASRAYVSQWAIRPDASGLARSAGDFGAGEANLTGLLTGADLLPDVERLSAYARIRQTFGDRLNVSGDLRFSRRAFGHDNAAMTTVLSVSAANPHFVSPDGSSSHLIAYSFLGDLGPSRLEGESRSVGATLGGRYEIGAGWSLDGYLAAAEERGESRTFGIVNSLFLEEALGNIGDDAATPFSTAQDGFFNPFTSGDVNGAAVLDFIGQGYSDALNRARLMSANLLLEGALWELPGGPVEVAVGAQARRETLETRYETFLATTEPEVEVDPSRERSILAVFGEMRIPIVGETNAKPGLRRLELSLAGRWEEYDDFGSTTNPKIGVVWSPSDSVVLRASYGTSYQAPGLTQMFDTAATTVTTVPQSDGSRVLAIYRYGGNPDLEAQEAKTWSAGFDLTPFDGARFSLSYFDARFTNRITQPVNENLEAVLTDSTLAPFVRVVDPAVNADDLALVRSFVEAPEFPYGSLYPVTSYGAILDGRWVNAAAVEVRGLDVSSTYQLPLAGGTLRLDASASYLFDYDLQTTSAAPAAPVLGRVGYPVDLRSRLGGAWSAGAWTGALHWNHVAAYEDRSGRTIDAWNTADLQLGWSPEDGGGGLQVLLSVQNLFDADPPFHDSAMGLGFDPGQADVLGRVASLQLIKRW